MARIIDSVTGHETQITKLIQLTESHRWPHAIIFAGPSGIGKKKIALAFAQVLVCEQAMLACGVCGACLRIEKIQSESLIVIAPHPDYAKPTIGVEQIRDLLSSLSLASLGAARVVIIDQVQTLNPQASNALLKTLEEPSENLYFILVTKDIEALLPTIRSRTQILRFSSLSYDEIKIAKPNLPDWIYRSSRGQLDRLELLSSKEGAQKREEALIFFEQFCHDRNFLNDKSWKETLKKDRVWALFCLNCWLQMARDAVILKTQAQKFVLNTDQAERLKLLFSLSLNKLLWLCQGLIQAEKEINSYLDPRLIFETLWIQYARVD